MVHEPRSNHALAERATAVFTPNYRPAELVIDRGEGCHVFDVEGRRYLDLISGIAVSALGHGHPRLVEAIAQQAGRVMHTSNLYLNEASIRLAERLVSGSLDRVYFCNSGAEANESAIKLARRHAWSRGDQDRVGIVSFTGSFHGRTFAALTATAQPKYHEGFHPLPAGFSYLEYGDTAALEAGVTTGTAAVIVEPIQGEGGVRVPPPGFLAAVRARCDEVGALLIFDEVQTGIGRTGTLYAHQHDGVVPDIMSLAKGIGGGLPLGAILARHEVAAALVPGTHATTYGGNPVACAAGAVVLDALQAPGFLEQVRAVGAQLAEGLRATGAFAEVRGRGLLIGAELGPEQPFDATAVVAEARSRGVLCHIAGARVLRLAPPLILGPDEAAEGLAALTVAVQAVQARGATS